MLRALNLIKEKVGDLETLIKLDSHRRKRDSVPQRIKSELFKTLNAFEIVVGSSDRLLLGQNGRNHKSHGMGQRIMNSKK